MAHINTWKLNRYFSTLTEVFLDKKRVNVCKHTVKVSAVSVINSLISVKIVKN